MLRSKNTVILLCLLTLASAALVKFSKSSSENTTTSKEHYEDEPDDEDDEQYDGQQTQQNSEDQQYDQQSGLPKLKPSNLKKNYEIYNQRYGNKNRGNNQQQKFSINLYQKNSQRIKTHNRNPNVKFQLGVTAFMKQDPKAFIIQNTMQLPEAPPQLRQPISIPKDFKLNSVVVDWRKHMSDPGQQKPKCGSCYAFSITSVLEAYYSIQNQQKKKYSEQQIVDCCTDGCNGCRGGWPASAMDYIAQAGLVQAKDYPYVAKPQECRLKSGDETEKIVNKDVSYNVVQGVDGVGWGLKRGPVSVIIDAYAWDPLYKSGVFDLCPTQKLYYNHAVTCSGRRKDGVWIVRNSWGSSWGDKGYIYLAAGNSCGIGDKAIIPNLDMTSDQQQQLDVGSSEQQDEETNTEYQQQAEDTEQSEGKEESQSQQSNQESDEGDEDQESGDYEVLSSADQNSDEDQ